MSASHKKQYLVVFVALIVLTALEVGVVYLKISRSTMIAALVGLAITKAAAVALFYMHLRGERRALKLTVSVPMLLPPLYAVVLMLEAIFRFTVAR